MFGNKEKPLNEAPVISNKTSVTKDTKTLIGEGCKVEGNFFIQTPTRNDGTIKGDLTGESGICIGTQGLIEGNICAAEVVVFGNVTGNIDTNRLELKKGASISGDLIVNNLTTELGSYFNGRCTMKVPKKEETRENGMNNIANLTTPPPVMESSIKIKETIKR